MHTDASTGEILLSVNNKLTFYWQIVATFMGIALFMTDFTMPELENDFMDRFVAINSVRRTFSNIVTTQFLSAFRTSCTKKILKQS